MLRLLPVLQCAAGTFEFLGDEFLVGKHSLIFSGEYLVGKIVEGVMSLCRPLFGAQNQADRWVFVQCSRA